MEQGLLWEWHFDDPSVVVGMTKNFKLQQNLALFDFDGTLILDTKKVPGQEFNFRYFCHIDFVRSKLMDLHTSGHAIVIISNQNGINLGYTTENQMAKKIEAVTGPLSLPMACVMAKLKDSNRKPDTGMFDWAKKLCAVSIKYSASQNPLSFDELLALPLNEELSIVEEETGKGKAFYVGDAAGRPKSNKRRKRDHSDCDKYFALNLGIKFYTPEKFFLGEDD